MVFIVELTLRAQSDAREYLHYLNNRSNFQDVGQRWWDSFLAALQTLRSMPERCPPYASARSLRYLLFGSHRIVFRLDKRQSKVVVLRVLHAARLVH